MAAAAHARSNPIRKAGGDQPPASSGGGGAAGSVPQQRLQGAFLTIIGLAGAIGGVLFSIEAPRFTPVPFVFLTFWLVMVIVGQVLFAGLRKLRAAGVGAPAPEQVRAAAAVAGIVVAVGLMGFAATTAGGGAAAAAPCPGGGPATCGPTPGQPELTFTPPAGQQTAPGGQQSQQGAQQDNNGIATSPAGSGGANGPGIQAQTPDFGTPGQPTPNIPGNEPDQPAAQQPGQGQQQQQQSPPTTTAGGPQQVQQTGQAMPTQSTVTVTQTQSECPAPGAAGGGSGGVTDAPGAGDGRGTTPGADSGPDGGEQKDGAPSWAYLAGEASALLTGRRRPGTGRVSPTGLGGGQGPAEPAQGTPAAVMQQPSVGGAREPKVETKPATQTYDRIIDPSTSGDGGGGAAEPERVSSTGATSGLTREVGQVEEFDGPRRLAWREDGGTGADGKEIIVTQLPNGQEMIKENGVTSIIGQPKPGQEPRDPYPVRGLPGQISTADAGDGSTTVVTTDDSGTPTAVIAPTSQVDKDLGDHAKDIASGKKKPPPDYWQIAGDNATNPVGAVNAAGAAGIDAITEQAEKMSPSDAKRIGRLGKFGGIGVLGLVGTAASVRDDMDNGMSAGEAIVSEGAGFLVGTGASLAAPLALAALGAPPLVAFAGAVAVGYVVGVGVTSAIQWIWGD